MFYRICYAYWLRRFTGMPWIEALRYPPCSPEYRESPREDAETEVSYAE